MKICTRTQCSMNTVWGNGCIALENVYDDPRTCPFFKKKDTRAPDKKAGIKRQAPGHV